MTEFDGYKILFEHVENHPDSHTLIAALNTLRAASGCVDCAIKHGAVLNMRAKLRKRDKTIRKVKAQLKLLQMPRPHRKIYTLPEVVDDDEKTDVDDLSEAINNGVFAPWRH